MALNISQVFECSICQSNFESFEAYWNHLKGFDELSRDGWIKINCPVCSTLFTNTKTLWNHVTYFCLRERLVRDPPCPHIAVNIPNNSENNNEMEVEEVTEIGPSLLA